MTTKKKYEDLTDLEKLQKQWHKLSGLHTSEEWSAAIVRAATAAEIAANFAVRKEFENKSGLDSTFVNSQLRWANGLAAKIRHLLIPFSENEKAKIITMKNLKVLAQTINSKRNAIAHQGEFCNEGEAKKAIEKSREFITTLVGMYEPEFVLEERNC